MCECAAIIMKYVIKIVLLAFSLLGFNCVKDDLTSIKTKVEIMVVSEENASGQFQLFVRDIDGSNPRPLTSNQSKSSQPSIAPGGDKIAYIMEGAASVDIYVINSDGTGNHKITHGGVNITPCWSADGKYILFAYAPPSGKLLLIEI